MNVLYKRRVYRTAIMVLGILCIGICVGSYRLSGFGVDPFTCMNLGISGFLKMQFGTWQMIVNALILIAVFFAARHCIGAGTVVNMVCVGYGADFIYWMVKDILRVEMTLPLRIVALLLGIFFAGLGVALYMTAEMGIAPYDSVAVIIEKWTKGKLKFQYARILSDVVVALIGVVFCAMAGNSIWDILGIGTIMNACLNGPLIQLFRRMLT